jgi:hypothetical protein
VTWIISDEDVYAFLKRVVTGRAKDIEESNWNQLQALFTKAEAEKLKQEEDDEPF